MPSFALISDIHEHLVNIEDVDYAIFCGDYSFQPRSDTKREAKLWHQKLGPYFSTLREKGIKLIGTAGNHDFLADSYSTIDLIDRYFDVFCKDGLIEFDGFNFLFFCYCQLEDWACFLPPDKVKRRCEQLSIAASAKSVDFLITHSPPRDYLSLYDWGSIDIQNLCFSVKPRVHCFGHIHETRGSVEVNGIKLVNCSYVDSNYEPTGKYWVYDTGTNILEERW